MPSNKMKKDRKFLVTGIPCSKPMSRQSNNMKKSMNRSEMIDKSREDKECNNMKR